MAISQNLRNDTISLTEAELTLKRLLLDVAKYNNPQSPSQLRFTGGWVRDKLLGCDSHDIDIGINDMTGEMFGLKIKEYLEIPGNPEKYDLLGIAASDEDQIDPKRIDRSKLIHGLHKIKANPEKSKNLETATTKVFGLDIDLVNLRKETYSYDSRNPQMEFGTPHEDAMRRDATINAMFYNLQDDKVEDLTGQGYNDLEERIIRTPLPAYQTFKDDPLRVLRLIRFASRLGYSVDPDAEQSMRNETIKENLKQKISRERVGVELEKMLRGPDPLRSLMLIDKAGLYHTIFNDPTSGLPYTPDSGSWHVSYEFIGEFLNDPDSLSYSVLIPNNDDRYIAFLLSAFVPWADAPEVPGAKPGSKNPPPRAAAVARECIKATNKVCELVASSVRNLSDIITIKDNYARRKRNFEQVSKDQDPSGRDTLGMAIRRWGPTWRLQVIYALMVEHTRYQETGHDILEEYHSLLSHIKSLDILNAYDFKPVIDGKSLATALNAKQGPWMKDALDVVMAWQLRNPNDATAEGAIEAVRNKNGELTSSLIRHFLQLTIRPLFSKQRTSNVTSQGHKMVLGGDHQRKPGMDEAKPWKDARNAFALELFAWVVHALNPQLTELHWPVLIPPLFALLDDEEIINKAQGCRLLAQLFKATSPAMMKRTGLGDVFRSAMDPCLSYLPTLTPEDESVMLLLEAYPAVFALIELQYGQHSALGSGSTVSDNTIKPTEKITTLSKLLHDQILPSITHLFETYARVTTLLYDQVATAIHGLGIHAAAHLVHILPLISATTTYPFAAAYPPLLSATMHALQSALANAWPRVYPWRGEILKALCSCWLQITEEEDRWVNGSEGSTGEDMSSQLSNAKETTRITLAMLRNAIAATPIDDDATDEVHYRNVLEDEIKSIEAADPNLSTLFTA